MTRKSAEEPPRALALDEYRFNFTVSLRDQVAARFGAPSWSRRRKRLDERIAGFWQEQQDAVDRLWTAATDGRIDEDGREMRQALLHPDGHDPIARRHHRRSLYRARVDPEEDRKQAFNRAWKRYLGFLHTGELAGEIEAFNEYFPIEANLPICPDTGGYLWMGEPWKPEVVPTAQDVLDRHPYR